MNDQLAGVIARVKADGIHAFGHGNGHCLSNDDYAKVRMLVSAAEGIDKWEKRLSESLAREKELRAEVERLANSSINQQCELRKARQRIEELEKALSFAAKNDNSNEDRIAELEQRLARVLQTNNPWPLSDVLAVLCGAVDHLLVDHNCDTHGHEEFNRAVNRGREILQILKGEQPTGKEDQLG